MIYFKKIISELQSIQKKESMTQQTDYDHLFKIVLLGDHRIGKSSFMLRYTDDIYLQNMIPTIGIGLYHLGVEFKNKFIQVEGKNNKLQIWDTAGSERYRSITAAYYRRANGLFLMFDITNRSSFDNLNMYMEQIEKYTEINTRSVVLIGLKLDLIESRKISKQQAQIYANLHQLKYMEVSSKQSININFAFEYLTQQMLHVASINNINHPIRHPLPYERTFVQPLVNGQSKYKCIQIIAPAVLLTLFIITAFLLNS